MWGENKSTGGGGLAWASSGDEYEGNRAPGCSSLDLFFVALQQFPGGCAAGLREQSSPGGLPWI